MSKRILVSLLSLAALSACGGGSDATGEINSLQGPQQVTIVEASGGSSFAVRLPRGVRGVTGSDYETDATRFWVRDNSMQALDTVNMILGYLHETNYWEQTNMGAYRALVSNEDRGGGERGQTGPTYEEWVVNSTRADNSSPQVVKFWIKSVDNGNSQIIYGRLSVTEEPTDSQPLGQFSLNFKAIDSTLPSTSTNTQFTGYLQTVARTDGQTELVFYNGQGDPDGTIGIGEQASRERVHVIGDMAAQTGRAYSETKRVENHSGTPYTDQGEYQLQFNSDYLARRDEGSSTLTVLDRNDYNTTVHRYGVYNATTEARVDQLSGFPIEDSSGHQGWAGYYGIWFPDNVTLTDGMTLYRRSFSDNTTTPYTLVKVPGKLEKRTRASITFADLQDEELDFFDPTAGGEAKVMFTGSDFVRTASRSGNEWAPESTPVSIASSFTTGQWLHFWSQARGSVECAWPATLDGSAPAYVWSSTVLNADSAELAGGDLTLYGYSHMLRAGITSNQANFASGASPYLPDASSVSSGDQTYVFDHTTLMLKLGGTDVNFANGVTVTSGPSMFGLDCGPLFPSALSSLSDIPNQTTTYQWSIGTNTWNQLLSLKDGNGAFVNFDPPTRFTYVHDEPGSPFDTRTFFLEWDGSNLGGIPFEQNSDDGRWYPLLNIPSGTTVTSGGTSYKIKQLEGEQFMVEVGSPSTVYTAQGFDLDSAITAPTAAPYEDPAIGEMPTVEAAPLYVGGVSQVTGG
jgi:hypothetical protein